MNKYEALAACHQIKQAATHGIKAIRDDEGNVPAHLVLIYVGTEAEIDTEFARMATATAWQGWELGKIDLSA